MTYFQILNFKKIDSKEHINVKYDFFIKQKVQNSTLLSININKNEYNFRNFGFSLNGFYNLN